MPGFNIANRIGYRKNIPLNLAERGNPSTNNDFEGGAADQREPNKQQEPNLDEQSAIPTEYESEFVDSEPKRDGFDYKGPKVRAYYADWVRAVAIFLVIFIHCLVNAADASDFKPDDHVAYQQKKDGIVKSLVQIGIPMFFYISGIASSFYNTESKGFALFLWDKILRLAVPFVVGIFVFLIPRLYFGQSYEDWTRPYKDKEIIEEDYWTFMIASLPDIFSKLSWLWYLPALFIDCILTYPLLAWTVRRSRGIPWVNRDDVAIIFLQIAILIIWTYPCFYLDTTGLGYGMKYLLPSTLTLAIFMFVYYTAQLLIPYWDGFAMLMKIIGPCASIALNLWKTHTKNCQLHHVLMMINYDAIFFSQGLIDQLYFKPMYRTRARWGRTPLAPLAFLVFILGYTLTSPQNYQQTGFLFFYPLYEDFSIRCLYTTGTWLWVYFITWLMHYVANKKFSEGGYVILTGCALYAYVSHYFYIIVVAVAIIRPFKLEFISALAVELVLVNGFILITYALFVSIYNVAFPPDDKVRQAPPEPSIEGSQKDQDNQIQGDPLAQDKPEDEQPLVENEEGKEGNDDAAKDGNDDAAEGGQDNE